MEDKKKKCPDCGDELEVDGACHKCMIRRSKENPGQFPAFAKKLGNARGTAVKPPSFPSGLIKSW